LSDIRKKSSGKQGRGSKEPKRWKINSKGVCFSSADYGVCKAEALDFEQKMIRGADDAVPGK